MRVPAPPRGPWARVLLALSFVGALLGADIASKGWAESELRRHGTRTILGGALILRYQTNSGIAFGLLRAPIIPGKREALIARSSLVVVVLAVLLGWKLADVATSGFTRAGLGALLAGAMGNLRDRINRGAVIDFVDVQLAGIHWPAFNFADVYLAVGIGLCLAGLLVAHRRVRAQGG